VVCLEREAERGWALAWMIRPELLADLPDVDRGPEG
jgi:hypothetical protein